MKNHQNINQDSGDFEYYTPVAIVNAARRTMGGIDLDPSSSVRANASVLARKIFTEQSNGLSRQWGGRVWMNHPFSRVNNPLWVNHLVAEFSAGRVTAACCITFAATSEQWFQPLLAQPQCYLAPRTNYYLADGSLKTGVTKGSVVTYFGPDVAAFLREFQSFGIVKI